MGTCASFLGRWRNYDPYDPTLGSAQPVLPAGITFFFRLTTEGVQAHSQRGITMIEYRAIGPPGCGKTTWLSRQVAHAVSVHGPDCVLLAALTRAAAARLAEVVEGINPEYVGTLHAHAFRSLGKPKLAQDKDYIDKWNEFVRKKDMGEWVLTKSLKQDDMGRAAVSDSSSGDRLYEGVEVYRHRMTPFEMWDATTWAWYQLWQDFKEMSFSMDFTDMIVKATEVIDHAPGNPRFIFLDEAQDLSLLELKLARKWAEHCEKFIMVGDPDQCLFEWRGSSPLNFETPPVSEENYKYLSQSYRVPVAVHATAIEWMSKARGGRREVKYLPRLEHPDQVQSYNNKPVQGACRIESDLDFNSPEKLLEDAQKYIDAKKTVMFLATAGYMLRPIIREMKKQGLPFHNPYALKRGDWNPLGAVGRRGVVAMAERIRAFAYGRWLSDARELRIWLEMLKLDHWRDHKWITESYLKKISGEFSVDKISYMFTKEAYRHAVATDYDWLVAGMKAQYRKLASVDYAIKIAKVHGETMLAEKPRIIVGTIHSVKGGESDSVYVFPDLSPAAWTEWENEYANAGTYRAFYVAMTRAREELILCGPSKSGLAVKFPDVV